jgi:hypothetical protein
LAESPQGNITEDKTEKSGRCGEGESHSNVCSCSWYTDTKNAVARERTQGIIDSHTKLLFMLNLKTTDLIQLLSDRIGLDSAHSLSAKP